MMRLLKVMAVDDEKIILNGLKKLLDWEKHGFQIIGEATDGIDAIRLARELCPDIIIIDINMPFKTGFEVIREVQTFLTNTWFIILTGYDDYPLMREAIQRRAADYLLKPVREEALLEALHRIRDDFIEQGYPQNPKAIEKRASLLPIDQMAAYIEENLHEKLTLSRLAEQFSMNTDYFSQYFKKKSGLNFSDFVNSRRVTAAKKLLETTDHPISQISDMVGFSDYRYFNKVFKNYLGMLPSQYRVRQNNN